MAVGIVVSETNGPSGSPTVTQLASSGGVVQYASVDNNSTVSGLATANGVSPGSYSFEKWHRLYVTGAAPTSFDSSSIGYSATAVEDSGGNSTYVTIKYGTTASYATPVSSASSIATTSVVGATQTLSPPTNSIGSQTAFVVSQFFFNALCALGDAIFPSTFLTASYSYH